MWELTCPVSHTFSVFILCLLLIRRFFLILVCDEVSIEIFFILIVA